MQSLSKHLYRFVERFEILNFMNHLASIVALLLMLPLSSYRSRDTETDKFLNFIAALENNSTFNYFTVIKVKDLNTGLTKEICTKGNFVSGALHIELNADYDSKGEQRVLNFARTKKDIYFEFKNKKALEIGLTQRLLK